MIKRDFTFTEKYVNIIEYLIVENAIKTNQNQ